MSEEIELEKRVFVLFSDNPMIGLTHGPSIQLVSFEVIEKRPGYILTDLKEIAALEIDEVWHDRGRPDGLKMWRVV